VGIKNLGTSERKKKHSDNSVKQHIIYEITTNTRCISKKRITTTNHKIYIQKKKPTNQIQKTIKFIFEKKRDYNLLNIH
jgi:hypothetical protein